MVIYLAGPMTGLPEHNFPTFKLWEKELTEAGHCVLSPEHINRHSGSDNLPDKERYAVCMRKDINAVLLSDMVMVLPGWNSSKGAKCEVHIAQLLGIPVHHVSGSPVELNVETITK